MPILDVLNAVWIAAGGWVLLWLLLHLFYRPFQDTFVDECRQKLFEARDAIFVIANDYHIERRWSDQIRAELNVFIRYAHRLTWQRILVKIYFQSHRSQQVTAWDVADSIADDRARENVLKELSRASDALADLIVKRSLVLRLLRLMAYVRRYIRKIFGVKRRDLMFASSSIVHDAYEEDAALQAQRIKDACTI